MDPCCTVPWEYEGPVEDSGISLEFLRHFIVQLDGRFTNEVCQQHYYNTVAVMYRKLVVKYFDFVHVDILKHIIWTIRTCKGKRIAATAVLYAFFALSEAIPDLCFDRKLLSRTTKDILTAMDEFGEHCGFQVAGMHALCAVLTKMSAIQECLKIEVQNCMETILQAARRHHTCERVRIWSLHSVSLLMPFLDSKQVEHGYRIIDWTLYYLKAYNHHIPTLSCVWHVVKSCLAMSENICLYFFDVGGLAYLSVATSSLRYNWKIQTSCFHVLTALDDVSRSHQRVALTWVSVLFDVISTMQHYPSDTELSALGVKLCHSALVVRASGMISLEFISNRVVSVFLQTMALRADCVDTHTLALEIVGSVGTMSKEALKHFANSGGVSRVLRSVAQFTGNDRLHKASYNILHILFQHEDALIPVETQTELGFDIIRLDMKNLRTSLQILETIQQNVRSRGSDAVVQVENGVDILGDFMWNYRHNVDAQLRACRLLKDSWQAQGEISRKFKDNPLIGNCLSFVVGNSKFPDNIREMASELLACLVENTGRLLSHVDRGCLYQFLAGERSPEEFRPLSFKLKRSTGLLRRNFSVNTMVRNVIAAMNQVQTFQYSVNLNGCEILRSLCSSETADVIQNAVIQSNGIEAVISAMDKYHTDWNLFTVGEDVLYYTCTNKTALKTLLDKGCVRVMQKKRYL